MFGFGGQNTSSFGTFGQANKPATSTFSGTGTGLFGSTPNTGGFGTTAQTGSVFGQPQQQQTAPTNIFGGFNQAKAPTTSLFGAPQNNTTMFGQNRLGTGSTTGGLFGVGGASTIAAVSPFSQTVAPQGAGGTSVQFNPITGQDTMMRNGIATPISTRNQCITTMKEYETKSLEELRMEDYQLGRKGPSNQAAGGFGATSNPTTASVFSMGQPAGTTTNFGQTSAFGSTAPTGGGLFSSPLSQNKPQNSFFNTSTSTAPFGGSGSFGNFGNTATSSTGNSLFSTTTTSNTGLGSFGSAFSQPAQPQQQQQQSVNLFGGGVKPLTAPATSTPFSFNTPLNKPAGGFGTTPSTFGTQALSQPFGTSSLFGGATNQQQPKPLFPSFSTAATSQSLFGTSNTFSFSTPTSAPAFSSASSTGAFPSLNTTSSFAQPISTTGFGNTPFIGFANMGSTGQSLFSNVNPAMNANIANPNASAGGPIPFGTTPYKDSPLFYNLVNNRSLEEMTKPTNPIAQRQIKEASRRKASTSIGTSATVKSLTFPTPKLHISMKDTLFDGFEEEDQGSTIDILSPKTSVKKLNLKNISFTRYQPNSSLFNGSGKDERNQSLDLSSRLNTTSNNESLLASNTSVSEIFPSRAIGDNIAVHESSSSDSPAVSFYEPINNHGHHEKSSYIEVLPGESADKTQEEEGNEEHVCGVKCTRVGYYMLPSVKDLDLMTDSQGNCFVRNFVIGRRNYGEIRFLDVVNVGNIDVDDIVLFRHKEVVVYPDDTNKPPVGEGINVPAEITLERVWPIDKVTKDPIKVPSKIKALKYEEKLRRSCARLDAEFVSYNEHRGEWVFRVKHFSKYSCAPEEDEDDAVMDMEIPKGGLGGKTIQQLKNATGSTQAIIVNERGDTNLQNFRKSPEHIQEVPSILEEEIADGRGDAKSVEEFSGVVPRDEMQVPPNAMDIFGEDESPADYPDYFGLSEPLTAAPSEIHKRYLTGVSAAKIVQHRRRDEEHSLEPERKLTNFGDLVPYPSSNIRRGVPVRFGPRSTFLFAAKGTKEYRKNNRFMAHVHIKQLLSHVEVHNRGPKLKNLYSKKIKDELTLVLRNSNPEDKFNLRPEGIIGELVELSNHVVQSIRLEQKSSNSKHQLATVCQDELQLWKLCEILWPSQELTNAELLDEGHQIQQRVKLSSWFKENAANFFGAEYDEKDVSIIGLLKKGRHSEACDLAISQGNFNLALNLTQCCGTGPKTILEEQILAWTEQDVLDFIPEEILRIYRLCAGIPIWDEIDLSKMNTSQWLQHFAVYLWYMCPMNFSIEEAVMHYQTLILKCTETNPDTEYPSESDASAANACVHLLKAFVTIGYNMKSLLNPSTNNPDSLDVRLSWLLMQNLKMFGQTAPAETVESITLAFATQLETLGIFEWSVYVLKTLPETEARDAIIARIVERNLTMKEDQLDKMEFLERYVGISRDYMLMHCFLK